MDHALVVAAPMSHDPDAALSDLNSAICSILWATRQSQQDLASLWTTIQQRFIEARIQEPFPEFITRVVPRFDLITILRAAFATEWNKITSRSHREANRTKGAATRLGLKEEFELFLWFGRSVTSTRCWKVLSKHKKAVSAPELFTKLQNSLRQRAPQNHYLLSGFTPRDFENALKTTEDAEADGSQPADESENDADKEDEEPGYPSDRRDSTIPVEEDNKASGLSSEREDSVDRACKDYHTEDSGIGLSFDEDKESSPLHNAEHEEGPEASAIHNAELEEGSFGPESPQGFRSSYSNLESHYQESALDLTSAHTRRQEDNSSNTMVVPDASAVTTPPVTPDAGPKRVCTPLKPTSLSDSQPFEMDVQTYKLADAAQKARDTAKQAQVNIKLAQTGWAEEKNAQSAKVKQCRLDINASMDAIEDSQLGDDGSSIARIERELRRAASKKRKAEDEMNGLEAKKAKIKGSLERMYREMHECVERHHERLMDEMADIHGWEKC